MESCERSDPAGDWPANVGVGGISVHRLLFDSSRPATDLLVDRLRRWLRGHRGPSARAVAEPFPFADLTVHYLAAGRNYVPSELVSTLRQIGRELPRLRTPEQSLLEDWLPSTVDQEDGRYDSYLVLPAFERLATSDAALDTELVALLAGLLLAEGTALAAARPAQSQRVRTQTVIQALARVGELAPRAGDLVEAGMPRRWLVGGDDTALAGRAERLARQTRARVPEDVQRVVDIGVLPTTPLHDEIMFIRTVQFFELLYRQVYRCLRRAATALQAADFDAAVTEIDDATRRMIATPLMYRVLTTMPRDAFHVIRGNTNGRSAVQSRAYRDVEAVGTTTLDELFTPYHGASNLRVRQLGRSMLRLDQAWRAMKRTHWGITRKIIGTVAGTGGTSGADYLEARSVLPLFPSLHEREAQLPRIRRSA